MINPVIIDSLKTSAAEFLKAYIDNSGKSGISPSERHWMEELSKIYLCAELHIEIPEHADEQFHEKLKEMTEFGSDSALVTRIIVYSTTVVGENDFLSNSSTYLSTLEHHQEHWSQQCMEASHVYKNHRPIEDFMRDYFENPQEVSEVELSYHLTLYFKHFYRFLYRFMLFYIESHSPTYYGRSNAGN